MLRPASTHHSAIHSTQPLSPPLALQKTPPPHLPNKLAPYTILDYRFPILDCRMLDQLTVLAIEIMHISPKMVLNVTS